jgi:multiple sugar transport system permease protein
METEAMATDTVRRNADWRERRDGWLFVLPAVVLVALLILLPIVATGMDSLFLDVAFRDRRFIFLDNYRELMSDPGFWQSLRFTLLFIAASVPLELLLGLGMALLLNARLPARTVIRAAVLIPWAVPAAVSARIWELIYAYSYGLANGVLLRLGLTHARVDWLGTDVDAFFAVVIADTWKTTPFVAIILLASLQTVPQDVVAQARIDRASFVQVFLRVTLPLIRAGVMAALLFRTIDALRVFDLLYVLTHGGPGGSTTSLSLYAHRYFLLSDFGYGSAVSVLLFVLALSLSLVSLRVGRYGAEVS